MGGRRTNGGELAKELERLRERVEKLESAEAALRELENRFNTFTRDSAYGYFETDLEGRIKFANGRAAEISGYGQDEVVGMSVLGFLVPEDRPRAEADMQEALAQPNTGVREYKILTKDGGERYIEANAIPLWRAGVPIGFQCTIHDVTARRRAEQEKARLEEERRQSQKLEAIGTLAGGIAHDFNNLLTGILAYASMLKQDAELPEKVHRAADIIERAATRGAELTGQLLGFARKGKVKNVPVDVHRAVEDVTAILERTLDKRIEIAKRLGARKAVVTGDPTQIHQVVLNLALNARDAMSEGGRLFVETADAVLDEAHCRGREGIAPGAYVLLSVSDTGCGMSDEVKTRIFEPFFTTKDRGTGMGLAMVYGIVKNHGGYIEVESAIGRGTTFRVYLPCARGDARVAETPEPRPPTRGHARVLLVEDEEVVLSATKEMLQGLGYSVATARDGVEAVEYCRSHKGEVDCVIFDLMMPRMDGRKCFYALRELDPGLRMVVCTGYGLDHVVQELAEKGAAGYLKKPFTSAQLSEVLAKTLAK